MRPSITYVMLLAATLSAVLLFSWGLHPILPRARRENTLIEHHKQASLANRYFCVSTYICIHVHMSLCIYTYMYTDSLSNINSKTEPGQLGLWNNQRICNKDGHAVLCRASLYGTASCTYLFLCIHASIYIYIYIYMSHVHAATHATRRT